MTVYRIQIDLVEKKARNRTWVDTITAYLGGTRKKKDGFIRIVIIYFLFFYCFSDVVGEWEFCYIGFILGYGSQ